MATEAVGGIYSTAIVTSFEVHKPEYLVEMFKRRGDQGASFFMLIETLGWSRPVAAEEYFSFEDNWIHETFHAKSQVSAPGAGNAILITLDSADLDASNRYYPQAGDDVLFPNEVVGRIQSIDVTTPTAPVLTIVPKVLTEDIGLVTAGMEIPIYSNSYGEGGGQPLSRVRGALKYTNKTKITKSTIGVTGSELTMQSWVEVWSEDGKTFKGYYMGTADMDMTYRHQLAVSNSLLVDKIVTNTANVIDQDPDSLLIAQGTEGLIPYMRRTAGTLPLATGALTVPTFDTIDRALNKQYAPSNMLVMPGQTRFQNIENVLVAYLANTNVQFAREDMVNRFFNGDAKKAAIIGFSSFMKSERLYNLHRLNDFHNPKTFGATGQKFEEMCLFVPMSVERDLKSGEPLPSIGSRYRELGGYNRKLEAWQDGAAGPGPKVGELDKKLSYLRSHYGAHFRGGNQMYMIYLPL